MQPILMLDGPEFSPSQQIVTLSTDVNGVGLISARTGVFVAGQVSCCQMSHYSIWISLTGEVRSGDDEINGTLTSQCDSMTDSAVDRS